MEEEMKIAAIRLDAVGDLILTTPALAFLKSSFPEASLTAIVSEYNHEVLEGNPSVDEILVWDGRTSSFLQFRKKKFDLVMVFSPLTTSYLAALACGGKIRVGYCYSSRPLTRFLAGMALTHTLLAPVEQHDLDEQYQAIPHEVEQNLEVVSLLLKADGFLKLRLHRQISGNERTDGQTPLRPPEKSVDHAHGFDGASQDPASLYPLCFPISEQDKNWAEEFFSSRGITEEERILGVHLSPAWEHGTSPDFCRLLLSTFSRYCDARLLVTYGPGEDPEQVKKIGDLPLIVAGDLTLKRWGALVRKCSVFVTTNTGALHLAAAVRVPTVAVLEYENYFYHSQRWRPWQVPHVLVRKPAIPSGETGKSVSGAGQLLEMILEGVRQLERGEDRISPDLYV